MLVRSSAHPSELPSILDPWSDRKSEYSWTGDNQSRLLAALVRTERAQRRELRLHMAIALQVLCWDVSFARHSLFLVEYSERQNVHWNSPLHSYSHCIMPSFSQWLQFAVNAAREEDDGESIGGEDAGKELIICTIFYRRVWSFCLLRLTKTRCWSWIAGFGDQEAIQKQLFVPLPQDTVIPRVLRALAASLGSLPWIIVVSMNARVPDCFGAEFSDVRKIQRRVRGSLAIIVAEHLG